MRHEFLVLPVKKWLKSVYIYGSYREIKTGVSLFWTTLYIATRLIAVVLVVGSTLFIKLKAPSFQIESG